MLNPPTLSRIQHHILLAATVAAAHGGGIVPEGVDGADGSSLPVVQELLRMRLVRWADHETLVLTMRGLRALKTWPVAREEAVPQ